MVEDVRWQNHRAVEISGNYPETRLAYIRLWYRATPQTSWNCNFVLVRTLDNRFYKVTDYVADGM